MGDNCSDHHAFTAKGGPEPRRKRARPREIIAWRNEEAYEMPVSPRERLGQRVLTQRDKMMLDAAHEAYKMRVVAERALWDEDTNESHPVLVRLREAMAAMGEHWGHVPEPGPSAQLAEHEPGDSRLLQAALHIAAILEEGDAVGRRAVLARVEEVRSSLGWQDARPLVREVIDQYALALAYAHLVLLAEEVVKRFSSPTESEHTLIALARNLGVAHDESDTALDSLKRAWTKRRQRAEQTLRRAKRLLRHVRKAGWLPGASASPSEPEREGQPDPLASLAVIPSVSKPPLRGEAALVAAELRAQIEAMREGWPPPRRIKWVELQETECPWIIFHYGFDPHDETGEWAVLAERHTTPDERLAYLARLTGDCE